MSGDISRENWGVPVRGLTRADPDGMARLVACRDGRAILHLTCAGTQIRVRLDISRTAQLSTGIWAAAGIAQQLGRPPRRRPVPTTTATLTAHRIGGLASRRPVGLRLRSCLGDEGQPDEGAPIRIGWVNFTMVSTNLICTVGSVGPALIDSIHPGQQTVMANRTK